MQFYFILNDLGIYLVRNVDIKIKNNKQTKLKFQDFTNYACLAGSHLELWGILTGFMGNCLCGGSIYWVC